MSVVCSVPLLILPTLCTAGVRHLFHLVHLQTQCSSKAESPKVVPKTRIWQAGMADVEHKVKQVWELRQDGSWDLDRSFPARLCLAGLWYECDSLHT